MAVTYKVLWTPLVYQDIGNTLNYISTNLANPIAAKKLLAEIDKQISTISTFPYSYSNCRRYFILDENYRHATIGNYGMFYRVDKEKKAIEILRFLYLKMNLLKISSSL